MEHTKDLYVTFPVVRTKADCQIVADFSQRNYVVGDRVRHITEQECRANANLFAAAPRLLNALKDAEIALSQYGESELLYDIRAAISIAEG